MARYLYAFTKSDNESVVCADDIAGQPVTEKYWCIECETELVAKVNGEIFTPHFAHKNKVDCNGETYLHKLAKRIFVETYKQCLAENTPYLINLKNQIICNKFKPAVMTECNINTVNKAYDLTRYYQEIEVEKRDGQFIPDVTLRNIKNPEEKIYIEIAVTHFLSKEKAESHNKIIEIRIDTEQDIKKIKRASLTPEDALFLGFHPTPITATDSECTCASLNYLLFYVCKDGAATFMCSSLQAVISTVERQKKNIVYKNIYRPPSNAGQKLGHYQEYSGAEYEKQMALAIKDNVTIKNCHLCRYHGTDRRGNYFPEVFCKYSKTHVLPNHAVSCSIYKANPAGS